MLPPGFLGDEGVVPPTSASPFFEASVVGMAAVRCCPMLYGQTNGRFQQYKMKLVGGLEHFLFSHMLGISSSQLTNIFQRGGPNHQPGNQRANSSLRCFMIGVVNIWGFNVSNCRSNIERSWYRIFKALEILGIFIT